MKHGDDGYIDITLERGLKDRAQRTLLDIDLALEAGELELIAPIEARLSQLIAAAKTEYLSAPEKIKTMLYSVYGIDVGIKYLDDAIYRVLDTISKKDYDTARKELDGD
jgi:hypothetical protein